MHPGAGGAAKKPQLLLGVHAALAARCAGVDGAHFAHPLACTVAINTAGGAVDHGLRQAAQTQRAQQSQGARVTAPVAQVFAGRRRQVQHLRGQPRQAAQRGRPVQVALQGGDALRAQAGQALRRRSQCQQTHAAGQLRRHALADVAASHNEQAGTTKARR